MKPLPVETRNDLARRFSISPDALTFLGGGREDSDGVVYSALRDGQRVVLKIAQAEDEAHVRSILRFSRFLSGRGIRVSSPLPCADGRLYETARQGDTLLIATVSAFLEGSTPDGGALQQNAALVREWGRVTGRMHRAAQDYPVWRNACEDDGRYGFEAEIDAFIKIAPDSFIREQWHAMKEKLRRLPIRRDTYGFIHNDNHQMNVIASGSDVAIIDFDCAECQFFANDLLLPVQGLLFDEAGGMLRPLDRPELLAAFYRCFLDGYREENELDPFWLEQLGLFLSYRRLLLYTVLQGWLTHDAQANEGFLRMIRAADEDIRSIAALLGIQGSARQVSLFTGKGA